jgi:hypothetical protein
MKKASYPKLRDFQNAHRKLLREYVAAIDVASRLPFFVNLTRLFSPREGENTYERINRQSWFLLTPFTWKPFVRFLVEAHIKAKMGELSVAYHQLSLRLPEGKEFHPLKEALKSAVTECHQLNETLTSWKSGKTFLAGAVPVVIGWITSWLGTDNLLSSLPQLGVAISENLLSGNYLLFFRVLVWVLISLSLLFLLFNQAFEGKRFIFLPMVVTKRVEVSTHNTYASEDTLFQLIGHKKTPEFALDVAAGMFLICLSALGLLLRTYFYSFSLNIFNLIAWPALLIFGVLIVKSTKQRWK